MRVIRFLTVFLVVFAMDTGGYAEEKRWDYQAELSFVDTGGNSDVTSLSVKNTLKYKFTEKLFSNWKVGALYGKSGGKKNAENYFTALRLDYSITEQFYVSAITGWQKDEFAGIDSMYYLGPSVGYKFLTGHKHLLLGEAGLRYVGEEYTNDTDKDYLSSRAFAKYEYPFTEKNKVSQSLEFLCDFKDSNNYNLNSETALISAFSNVFSLKTSYVIRFDNQPVPSTLKKTDTVLALTLIANF